MNEYFEEYTREQDLAPHSREKLEDPRYYKNADALYKPPPAYEVLLALCTYPGIGGPMFDSAVISSDRAEGQVHIELDDLTHTEYTFGDVG